jgi:hypothetical protein
MKKEAEVKIKDKGYFPDMEQVRTTRCNPLPFWGQRQYWVNVVLNKGFFQDSNTIVAFQPHRHLFSFTAPERWQGFAAIACSARKVFIHCRKCQTLIVHRHNRESPSI